MTFGELIKAEREKKQLSYRELARRAGISSTTLLYIENGQTKDPRLSLVVALMGALGLRWRDLTRLDALPRPRARRARGTDAEEDAA